MRGSLSLSTSLLLASLGAAITITSDPTGVINQTYTHIVVGGGTGGLAVASRLAEVSSFKILVIEAGPDARYDPVINDPGQEIASVFKYSWFYETIPQEINNTTMVIPQGKVLGGSSAINGMQWTRGTLDQYDTWQRLGNPGWNSTSLFYYMKKSEKFNIPSAEAIEWGATYVLSAHGTIGPINSGYNNPQHSSFTYNSYVNSILNFFNSAASGTRGPVQKILDLCTGAPLGVVRFFYSVIPGIPGGSNPVPNRRSSSAVGYVYPYAPPTTSSSAAGEKNNLIILVGYQATNILWSSNTDTSSNVVATGVAFIATPTSTSTSVTLSVPSPTAGNPAKAKRDTTQYQVDLSSSSGQVIVSSGALGSPTFLERSGVGNSTILSEYGIDTVVDLPAVGTNLQDQPLTTSLYNISSTPPPGIPQNQYDNTTNQITEGSVAYLDIFQVFGKAQGTAMAQQLLDTAHQRAEEIVASGGHTSVTGLTQAFTEQAESMLYRNAPVVEMSFGVNYEAQDVLGNIVWNLLPQVRGTVHIQSADPTVLPAVNPRYLTTEFELLLHSNATRLSRLVCDTAPLSSIITVETQPGSAVPDTNNDTQWQNFVISNVSPVIHPVGSNPMLPQADGGVVDSNLKVYGTANVRVVDSSIIPIQISAHLSATVYGIAEKAADILKGLA